MVCRLRVNCGGAVFFSSLRIVVAVGLIVSCAAAISALRRREALKDLAALIDPVPQVTDVGSGVAASTVSLADSSRGPAPARVPGRYWSVETERGAAAALDFYRLPGHRRGWDVIDMTRRSLTLARGGERLYLLADEAGPSTAMRLFYDYRSAPSVKTESRAERPAWGDR